MNVYLRIPDAAARRAQALEEARGRRAMYRLLVAQRRYCCLDPADAEAGLARAEVELSRHLAAPEGCVFVSRAGADDGSIWVLGPDRREIYVGPAAGYRPEPGDVADAGSDV